MENRYSISDCILDCETLSRAEAVGYFRMLMRQLEHDIKYCLSKDKPNIERLYDFAHEAIFYIGNNCTDAIYPDNKFADDLLYLCSKFDEKEKIE